MITATTVKNTVSRAVNGNASERFADGVFVVYAAQGSGEDDHRQADQPNFRQMEGQRQHQPNADQRLHHQLEAFLPAAAGGGFAIILFQHVAHRRRQLRAIAKQAKTLYQPTDQQTAHQHRQRDRRHPQEEIDKAPARAFGDDQVLRLAYHGHDPAERGADAGVHQQAAQKGAELFQRLLALFTGEIAVIADVAIGAIRRHVVIDGIKPVATLITTATTVSASRKAERKAAAGQNASDSSVFERMLSSSL